jgi:hypothetical protein
MATKLGVYNSALIHLEERRITSLTEDREPRRVLDAIWDGSVKYCLAKGQWNFAMRSVEITPSSSVTPDFGYTNAFEVPDDWVRTAKISASPTFSVPLEEFSQEGDYWYANVDPLYVQYVSSDTSYGFDLGKWDPLFEERVAIRLAFKSSGRITSDKSLKEALFKLENQAQSDAASVDAMNGPASFPPMGSWGRSRFGTNSFILNGRRNLR